MLLYWGCEPPSYDMRDIWEAPCHPLLDSLPQSELPLCRYDRTNALQDVSTRSIEARVGDFTYHNGWQSYLSYCPYK